MLAPYLLRIQLDDQLFIQLNLHQVFALGLPEDTAKKITKLIRDEFPKVKSQIQGDAVRVSGKSRDDLQRVMGRLRELDLPVPLQFENYR